MEAWENGVRKGWGEGKAATVAAAADPGVAAAGAAAGRPVGAAAPGCLSQESCLSKEFGFFGLCDPSFVYGHGSDFLESMLEMRGDGAAGAATLELVLPPPASAAADAKALAQYDRNKNGKLDADELAAQRADEQVWGLGFRVWGLGFRV